MKKYLLYINILLFLFVLSRRAGAQTNQNVVNGGSTTPVTFSGAGCTYNWTNSNPAIGLPASGTGNILPFTTVNTGTNPVTATITATPVSSGFAYIANSDAGSNTVSVINITTASLVYVIPVGKGPRAVSVSPDGTKAYVANTLSNTVSVINTATNLVVFTIIVGTGPDGVAVSPDGSLLYVANSGSGNVAVINTATNNVLTTINVGAYPCGITVSPDGSSVYVANSGSNNVTVINAATNTVLTTIIVGGYPIGLALSPNEGQLYIANYYDGTVSAINTTTNKVIATIPVGSGPVGMAASADGSKVYVSNQNTGTVSVINPTTNLVVSGISLEPGIAGISVTPDGNYLYVANSVYNNVSIVNTTSNSPPTIVSAGGEPISLGNFISGGVSCTGVPVTFTITVNPTPTSFITASPVMGAIVACVGSPSASPNEQQFTVAGTTLAGDITVTAPTGFEVSLTATGIYSSSLVLKQSNGAVTSTTIYVRSAASDPVGTISGNVQITTPGATPVLLAVMGVVHALPTINPVQNFVYNNGDATAPINFSGMGNYFTWTNDNPYIGVPSPGDGDISSFTATNSGNKPLIATFTVTPNYRLGAYIANNLSNNVSLINTGAATLNLVGLTPQTINVGQGPWGVSLSPDYSKVYITNNVSGTVSVINTSTNAVTTTVNVGAGPEGVLVSRDGNSVYVANNASGTVSVINAATNIVTTTIPVGNNPTQLTASPDGRLIYVSNHDPQGTISVINTAGNTVTATISALNYPTGLAISPDGSKLYVASDIQNNVTVINTANYSVVTTIPTGPGSTGIAMSPDGSRLYVTNSGLGSISIINTATNMVSGTIGGGGGGGVFLSGICISPDGSFVCVVDARTPGGLDFIPTSTNNNLISTLVGQHPLSYGNFIMPAASCPGTPITFTITVNPSPPSIKATEFTGTISACAGNPAASPNIGQFIVSGTSLTGDITAVAPPAGGFEVSLAPGSGYGSSVTIPQVNGTATSQIVYVRSAASDAGSIPGNIIPGNVTVSSPGTADLQVAVTATVYDGPTMDPVASQTVTTGQATAPVDFTGAAGSYSWTNDTPGIGLPANGKGDIPSFTAANAGPTPVIATITVTPQSMSLLACNGTPTTFTITVNPPPPPVITSSGSLSGLSTIYGIASASGNFEVSANNTQGGILVTPPKGFEVSTDNQNFNATVTAGQAGSIGSVPVYIRLAATTPAGVYSGGIELTTRSANEVDINMPQSLVEKAMLTVTAPDVSRAYGVPNPVFTPSYQGFVNGDNQSDLTTIPELTTIATTNSPVGQYVIHVSGGSALNYNIIPVDGTLTIFPTPGEIIIPNAFTPNGDGINDLWDIKQLVDFPQCLVSVYSRYGNLVFQSRGYAKPWDGTYNGSPVPTGTYYYIIIPQSGSQKLAGYVTVLR